LARVAVGFDASARLRSSARKCDGRMERGLERVEMKRCSVVGCNTCGIIFSRSGKRRGWERRIERILIVVVSESARE
jgi:hypothetical protein